MHMSPQHGQPRFMSHPLPVRSAKVLSQLAATLAVLLCCGFLALPVAAQDAAAPADPHLLLLRPADRPVEVSDEIVRDVLLPFQRALETHNLDHLLDTFDPAAPDFPRFRDQFRAFFRLTDAVKLRYQILQAAADGPDTAYAIADIDMDALPADSLPTEQRRSTQMRLQMTRTPKGWRLTALKPLDFFTQ